MENLKRKIFFKSFVIPFLILFLIINCTRSYAQLLVGSHAPDIKVTNWINNKSKQTELTGKFIVIDFWATWCAPCLAAQPNMNKLRNEFKDREDLIFLSISDEPEDKIQKLLKRFPFDSFVVTDTTGSTQDSFKIKSLPTTFLINAKGDVFWEGVPSDLNVQIITDLLNEKSKPHVSIKSPQTSLDSLYHAYRLKFDDPELDQAFGIMGPNLIYYNKSVSRIGNEEYNIFELGVKLNSLFANLLNCSESQIELPEELKDKAMSYYFKENNIENKNQGQKILMEKILRKLNLNLKEEAVKQKVYEMDITNIQKLIQNKIPDNEPSSTMGKSASDNNKVIAIHNNSLMSLKALLQNSLNIPVFFVIAHVPEGNFNITLNNSTFKKLQKSTSFYGLKISRKKKRIPYYRFTILDRKKHFLKFFIKLEY